MKIAFTSSGKTLEDALCPRFGRADRFLVYDLETSEFSLVENAQNLNAAQGAGIQAAQLVVNAGAKVLVTGHCGPKAFSVLKAGGVRVFHGENMSIADALEAWRNQSLVELHAADVDGHWV
ncbi:MAG: dinitrogenase iron-molybdenum cofactor biosynthesis protein [Candidatus Hydrogenedens sp.]|jgi:predicted Fe-Mo cluster-binding NifX family protein|nr:dinitrogenase iron-molybdenum cofactor biosynthesis protein [Candidatus Hydrogenedens sp.]